MHSHVYFAEMLELFSLTALRISTRNMNTQDLVIK